MGKLLYNDNIFNRTMSKVFDLLLLGFLTFICSLPILTAGAASFSAHKIALEMTEDREGPVGKSFFKYFKYALKHNYKDSLIGWGILFVSQVVLLTDLFFLTKINIQYRSFLYGVIIVLLVSVIAIKDWYYLLKATFIEKSIKTLKNSVGFYMVYMLHSLLAGIYTLGAFYILTRFPYLIGIIIVLGNFLLKYPKILLYKNKINKYLVDRGIDSEEIECSAFVDDSPEEMDESFQELNAASKELNDSLKELDDSSEKDGETLSEILKGMSRKQKLEYIFTYYKPHMAFVGASLLIIGVIIHQAFIADHRDCFQVAAVNAYIKEGDIDISDRLSETLVSDTSKEKVHFDTQYQLEYPGVKNMLADTSFQEKLLLNIGVGSVDVAILPKKFVDFCNQTEYIFRDVSTVLDEENMKLLRDNLIYTKDENGKRYPCGIEINNSEFVKNEEFAFLEGSKGDDVIMVFPINSDHNSFCNEFVEEVVR